MNEIATFDKQWLDTLTNYDKNGKQLPIKGLFSKSGASINYKKMKASYPKAKTFDRCKVFKGNNVCDKYELSITGRTVLSSEEYEDCADLFVPAKCE